MSLASPDAQPLLRQSFPMLARLAQRLRDERSELTRGRTLLQKRVAVVGGFTTQFVTRLLDPFLVEAGIDAELYESPYGTLVEQVLNPASELYAFQPDLTLLLVSRANLATAPALRTPPAEVAALAQSEADRFLGYAELIASRISTRVILSNFELPAERALGNFEGSTHASPLALARAVNARLAQRHGPAVLFDLEYLSARHGLARALDTKAYCLTKQPFSFDFLAPYCHALARSVAMCCGLSKKCVVLDLDGTLWGGTLAEDGWQKLELGPDSAEGEAFSAFQRYLKQLKERGVLLAVCSKNDDQTARRAFESPSMLLSAADIACFVANWENKAENIVSIARKLNIGLDALVFVDNSAEERHLIRQQLPEVTVIELPDDPAEYVRALDEAALFELAELSGEALQRTASLQQEQQREQAQARFVDYAAYLCSLELRACCQPILGPALERCAELMLRSNQFNLRTVRHSQADLQVLLASPLNIGFCVSLTDRFGSYGIISVVILEHRADSLFIDTWLMSCRVLKKGVEALAFQEILAHARRLGVRELRAEYRRTDKNAMVAGLLPTFGFEAAGDQGQYRLQLEAAVAIAEHFIHVEKRGEHD